jgi:hypothetical protein
MENLLPSYNFHPDLKTALDPSGIDPSDIQLGLQVEEINHRRALVLKDRRDVFLRKDDTVATWHVPVLSALWRGDEKPPAQMQTPPPEYDVFFLWIEQHVLAYAGIVGDPTDQDLERVYGALRRRPDGKSLGILHDVVWQTAAVLLGRFAISQAQFEAIFGRLEKSTRTFGMPPVSRNYILNIRELFDKAGF